MKKRIFTSIFLVVLAVIAAITTIVTIDFYQTYSRSEVKQLQNESQLVIRGVKNSGVSFFDDLEFNDYRITWISSDGSVIYDTSLDSSEMENHLEREEIKEAIETGYGESKRYSKSILKESLYIAYRLEDSTIIRLSLTQNSVFFVVINSLYPIYIVIALAFAAALILSFVVSKRIVDPINNLDLDNPLNNEVYPEVKPLLERIDYQRNRLINDKEEIEKSSLIRQEFTANVSHELKTPLHIISGYSELIRDGIAKTEDIPQFATKINKEATRMAKLIEDIMQLSKLDNGVADGEKTVLYLDSLCDNVIDSLKLYSDEKNVTINPRLKPIEIIGYSDAIYELVYNLVDNAIKYNKDGGEVDIVIETDKLERPVLKVTDTGIGIPNDQIHRIFERFYRVDKSRSRDIGGTGLGLSIVKHAALLHGAEIEVLSTLNEGTTFKVTFPR